MKFEKERLVAAVKREHEAFLIVLERRLRLIEDSDSVDSFMRAKREYMVERFSFMPTGNISCPFCLEHRFSVIKGRAVECRNCGYAVVHGCCVSPREQKRRNDFRRMRTAVQRARKAILELYYNGTEVGWEDKLNGETP